MEIKIKKTDENTTFAELKAMLQPAPIGSISKSLSRLWKSSRFVNDIPLGEFRQHEKFDGFSLNLAQVIADSIAFSKFFAFDFSSAIISKLEFNNTKPHVKALEVSGWTPVGLPFGVSRSEYSVPLNDTFLTISQLRTILWDEATRHGYDVYDTIKRLVPEVGFELNEALAVYIDFVEAKHAFEIKLGEYERSEKLTHLEFGSVNLAMEKRNSLKRLVAAEIADLNVFTLDMVNHAGINFMENFEKLGIEN